MPRKDSETAAGAKKSYDTPRITLYGSLEELTTGGSGHAQESSKGARPRA